MIISLIVNGRKACYPVEICPAPILAAVRRSCWRHYFDIKNRKLQGDVTQPRESALTIEAEFIRRDSHWNSIPIASLPMVSKIKISDQIADEIPVNVVQFPVQKSA